MADSIERRKSEHIDITLNEKVTGDRITTGFERYSFVHQALPEIDFGEISLDTDFLGFPCRTPFLISSMTGGTALAGRINRHLAEAAEESGWVLALGSGRALLDGRGHEDSFRVREHAPGIPIIANLGAVQLNYGFGLDKCRRIIEMMDADMLVLHLNSIQEVIQNEGDLNFGGLLGKIEALCRELDVPVGVKEVGWGIDGGTAKKLVDAGVSFIDTAGAGGTSWSQVEKFRSADPVKRAAAEAFSDWGIPTADSLRSVRAQVGQPVIASGGLRTGLDAAKALALGADLAGFGRSILREATESTEAVLRVLQTRELELRIAMFGIGARNLDALKNTPHLTGR